MGKKIIMLLFEGDPKAVALKYDLFIRKTNPAPADSISRKFKLTNFGKLPFLIMCIVYL